MPSLSDTSRMESLFARTKHGIKPGLETMQELVAALDHPEKSFLCIHVAGTNGKGSVCAMVASVLQEMGLKTGLFTSPHLVRVNERIRIQGEPVSDQRLHACLDQMEAVEPRLNRPLTFFETLTGLAFLSFQAEEVQIAVIETGLGGRLDSTNVVQPLVTGITRIDMDHQEFLGTTLSMIAGEKAGILKSERPAVIGAQVAEAYEVLLHTARQRECPVWDVAQRIELSGRKVDLTGQSVQVSTPDQDLGRIQLPLLGSYQMENLATAVCLLEATFDELGLELSPKVLKAGLAKTDWPARGQLLSDSPPLILDVAHNPGGAKALRETLVDLFGRKAKGVWFWSSLSGKDPDRFLSLIQPYVAALYCVELNTPRALSGSELMEHAGRLGCPVHFISISEAKATWTDLVAEADFACVAGSVYLAGAWLAESATDPGEQGSTLESKTNGSF